MFRSSLAIVLAGTLTACWSPYRYEPPPAPYVKFATLAPDIPEFIPGLGTLYVEPGNRPFGPYRAYDRSGKLTATVFMVPVGEIHPGFRQSSDEPVVCRDRESTHYVNQMHGFVIGGVMVPHQHITAWCITEAEAAAVK